MVQTLYNGCGSQTVPYFFCVFYDSALPTVGALTDLRHAVRTAKNVSLVIVQ